MPDSVFSVQGQQQITAVIFALICWVLYVGGCSETGSDVCLYLCMNKQSQNFLSLCEVEYHNFLLARQLDE